MREQVAIARDGALNGVGVSEHHVTDDHQYLLNEAIVAHLADAVGDLRLTTALCLQAEQAECLGACPRG